MEGLGVTAAQVNNVFMDKPNLPPDMAKALPRGAEEDPSEQVMQCSLTLGLLARSKGADAASLDFSGSRWFAANSEKFVPGGPEVPIDDQP